MKSRNLITSVIFTLLATSSFAQGSQPTIAGGDGGHGGDPRKQRVVMEFVEAGNQALAEMKKLNIRAYPQVNIAEFEKAVRETTILPLDDVKLNGNSVPSKNYIAGTKKTIEVCVSCWEAFDKTEKLGQGLHEYGGIVGFERDHYQTSASLLAEFKRNGLPNITLEDQLLEDAIKLRQDIRKALLEIGGRIRTEVTSSASGKLSGFAILGSGKVKGSYKEEAVRPLIGDGEVYRVEIMGPQVGAKFWGFCEAKKNGADVTQPSGHPAWHARANEECHKYSVYEKTIKVTLTRFRATIDRLELADLNTKQTAQFQSLIGWSQNSGVQLAEFEMTEDNLFLHAHSSLFGEKRQYASLRHGYLCKGLPERGQVGPSCFRMTREDFITFY